MCIDVHIEPDKCFKENTSLRSYLVLHITFTRHNLVYKETFRNTKNIAVQSYAKPKDIKYIYM